MTSGDDARPIDGGVRPRRRPRLIRHMIASIDARIVTGRWPELGG